MRFRSAAPIVLTLTLPALAGCEVTPKERLEGKWVGEKIENVHSSQLQRAQGWVSGATFEFQGSRVTVSIPAESPRQGTYKIATVTEDQLTVSFFRPHGAKDDVTLLFEADDRLRWMLGDGRSIVMRKVVD